MFSGGKVSKKIAKKTMLDVQFVFKLKKNLSFTLIFCYFAPQKGDYAFINGTKSKTKYIKWHLT